MSDYSIAIKIGGKLEKSFTDAIRAAQGGLSGMDSSVSKGAGSMGKFGAKAAVSMAVAAKAAQVGAAAISAAGRAVADVGRYSVQVGKDFETAMSSASATASASKEDFAKMKQAAMEMGKTTSKTATESAQALEYMALAGWDVDTSISALPSVLKMSEATGMDLARTSDLVTDSMAALGVSVNELPNYLDVAAKAQNKSNQTAEQLMEAYLGVGGTMKNLNVPLTESATALGILANRGIKGSEAGNALNAIMLNLTTGTGQAGKMMQSLGVSAFDSQGNFIGLEATLQQLNTALAGCSEEERNAAMAAIGGKQHVDALNNLMAGLNTTNEEGVSEWAALTNELENCNGSLDAMRDTKLDNLEGDLATLQSATQDVGIKIYEHMNTPLRDFAQFGTQAVYQVSDALQSGGFSGMAGAIGDVVSDGLAMLVSKAPDFLAMGLEMLYSFEEGLGKNASGIAQSLMSLIATAIGTVIKNLPRHLMSLGSIAVGLVKGVMISIGNGIKQAVPQILTLVPVLFAKLLGSILHAAPKLITAIPGVIKTAFGAILKLNPISIGIAIIKAIIKGILSMGKSVLGAFKSALLGGKEASKEAGEDATEGYAAGAEGGLGDPADHAATAEASTTGGEALNEGEGQLDPGFSMGAALPSEEAAAAADTAPALQASADSGVNPSENMETEAQTGQTNPAGVLQQTAQIPGEELEAPQAPTEPMGLLPAEPLRNPAQVAPSNPGSTPVVAEATQMPPDEAVQESTFAATEMPTEAVRESAKTMKEVPAEAIADTPPEAAQESAGAALDVPAEALSESVESAVEAPTTAESAGIIADTPPEILAESAQSLTDAPADALQTPPETVTDTMETVQVPTKTAEIPALTAPLPLEGIAKPTPLVPPALPTMDAATAAAITESNPTTEAETPPADAIPPGTEMPPADTVPPASLQMPPEDIEKTGRISQVKDALSSAGAASLAGKALDASGLEMDNAAFSQTMGAAGALGGKSLLDGLQQKLHGTVDAPQVEADASGIDGDSLAQAAQIPLEDREALPNIPKEALQSTASEKTAPAGAEPPPEVLAESGAATQEGTVLAQEGTPGKMQDFTLAQETQDAQETQGGRTVLPAPEGPAKKSLIGEILELFSRKDPEPDTSASGSSPQIIYNPIFNIKGSGDVKEDVEKANRMGMREFEELMEAYLKKNKRVKFG